MPDRKFDLTRRKALLSMGTIGVAGATGAGAWARFTDRERKIFKAEAGTLDLQFKTKVKKRGDWHWKTHNGPVVVKFNNLKNRDHFKHCEWLINKGTVPGDKLTVKLSDVIDKENGKYEMEESLLKKKKYDSDGNVVTDSDGKPKYKYKYYKDKSKKRGELSKFILVAGFIWCFTRGKWRCRPVDIAAGTLGPEIASTEEDPTSATIPDPFKNFEGFVGKLRDLEGEKARIDMKRHRMDPGDKCLFCVFGKFSEKLTRHKGWKFEDANIAQSDKTYAKVDFKLEQNKGEKVKGEVEFPNDNSNS